jgi:hypothetical protein
MVTTRPDRELVHCRRSGQVAHSWPNRATSPVRRPMIGTV